MSTTCHSKPTIESQCASTRQRKSPRISTKNRHDAAVADIHADTNSSTLSSALHRSATQRSKGATAQESASAALTSSRNSARSFKGTSGVPGGVLGAQAEEWQSQFFKTKLCPYHLEGRCINGASCKFAHSADELRPLPNLHRTKLCESYVKKEICRQPDCPFAHNPCELRTSSHSFYKVTLCNFYKKGRCWNGVHCRFAHGTSELQAAMSQLETVDNSTEATPDLMPTKVDEEANKVRRLKSEEPLLASKTGWSESPPATCATTNSTPASKSTERPSDLSTSILNCSIPTTCLNNNEPTDSSGYLSSLATTGISSSVCKLSEEAPSANLLSAIWGEGKTFLTPTTQIADIQTLTTALVRLLHVVPDAASMEYPFNGAVAATPASASCADSNTDSVWLAEFLKEYAVIAKDHSSTLTKDDDEKAPLDAPSLATAIDLHEHQQPQNSTASRGSLGLLPSLSNLIFSSAAARSSENNGSISNTGYGTAEDDMFDSSAKQCLPLSLGQLVGFTDESSSTTSIRNNTVTAANTTLTVDPLNVSDGYHLTVLNGKQTTNAVETPTDSESSNNASILMEERGCVYHPAQQSPVKTPPALITRQQNSFKSTASPLLQAAAATGFLLGNRSPSSAAVQQKLRCLSEQSAPLLRLYNNSVLE